jgi:hypothetical protein
MNEIPDKKADLFEFANQNAKRIADHFITVKKKYGIEDETVLEEFVNFVKENWTLSINLKLSEINSFLISGIYQNMYQVIEDDLLELKRERGVDISKEEAARNRMGIFFEKRKIFENQFEESDRFIYASLNVGGIGLKKYGEFSLITHKKEVKKISSCAFLKKESISYVNNGKVNIEQLKHDTANRETVHLLTAIKNEKDLPRTAKKNWPKMVCHEKNYIEAVTADEISIKHISTVRMSKDSYDLYFDYLYKAYGSRLDESEKLHLRAFKDMLKLLAKNGIDKEIIDGQEN